jgi:acyl-CoA synthetase (NDP forming)/GNAT superfamily N-acetyltransferase
MAQISLSQDAAVPGGQLPDAIQPAGPVVVQVDGGQRSVPTPVAAGWDALLTDGGVARIRPVVAADAGALRALHDASSDRSIYLRYFNVSRLAGEQYVEHLVAEDDRDRLGLVAEVHGAVVGMASCERIEGTADAEVAFLVADHHHRRGVGTLLLEQLAALARHAGVRRFVAETLAENGPMLTVFTDAGFPVAYHSSDGVTAVTIPLAPTPAAQAAVDERERAADVRSLRHVLAPASVAVVGAGDRAGTVGAAVLGNVLAGGFTGPVHPVNPRHDRVAGLPAYPSVAAIPIPPDLVVIAVPAGAVPGVIADCGAAGVPAAVVITAGFGETDHDGAGRERDLLRLARAAGVRLVGPNCLGVASTDPAVRLNATFSATPPVPGTVGIASQSGALGIGLLAETARRGLGVSDFVSLGNKLDVSANDLLLYWENDPRTRVVALYLESFGNPAKFLRHAARVARRKPVIALKAGRSAAGSRAGASHTAAAATPHVLDAALLRQAGVLQVETTEELLDVAQLLAAQPVPAGARLGIIGNSGGPGILAADTADAAGLAVPELSAATQAALRAAAPGLAGAGNPVDLGAAASPAAYQRAVTALLASGEVDAAVVIYAWPLVSDPEAIAAAIRRAAATAPAVPVAAALLATDGGGMLADPGMAEPALPRYDFPEAAVRALGHAARYGGWLRRRTGTMVRPAAFDADAVRAIAVRALADRPGGGWLDPVTADRLLSAAGIVGCRTEAAHSCDEAVAAAARVGYPVALKTGAAVAHRTELGGVRTGLADAAAVRAAYDRVAAAGSPAAGVLVQAMARPGVELIAGMTRVRPYPPMILVGLGGTATELLGDTAVRLGPLRDADAREAIDELRSAPLLYGHRGAPVADVGAVEDLLLRVSALADELPELAELDLNPVIAGPDGAIAVDVKVRLAPVPADDDLTRDPLVRRLR